MEVSRKKVIVFDFDRTLFETDDFKKHLVECLMKIGISRKDFIATYKKSVTKNKDGANKYSLNKHVYFLGIKKAKLNKSFIRRVLLLALKDSYKFVKREALKTLKDIKKYGYITLLLTCPNTSFQKNKVKLSGLGNCFYKQIYYSGFSKSTVFGSLLKQYRSIVFVSDDLRELKSVKYKYETIDCIMMNGGYGTPQEASKMGIKVINNLLEIKTIIKGD